ncbi:hypothetical protein BT63DRAFT_433835 [Microthyrium microscopicum]|uniref:STB6-like N-terminal domain-containing protein n=1 Tax=Microthyrium microscopicum TaxID=703497 RepID=A0A6A6U4M2_9PEZI|nr:hypothetical protein BT63DRAFT_433835 [Microthyrium microscopicum]
MAASKLAAPANHQRFVFTDPIAVRYLEEDPATHLLARRETLHGYESYLVEQWACSRKDPTFTITTYTGEETSKVVVGVLSVPTDESTWSQRLKVYFQSLNKYHARKKETYLGTIMITNLSGFPSSLTVIPIPGGDIRANREAFFVNEDLKRLGCSGRVGLTLSPASSATAAKFYQLYRVSDKNPLNLAVIELVKLCQTALLLFGNIESEYVDGLLCDVTEKAINDWWLEFGSEYYNVEPHDGILGPTTVSALLGLLTGARNRLHAYGAPISKDVFDLEHTKRAIAYFQKGHRLPKTRRLDRQTLSRIHRSTAKAASGDGWFVPKAVKSTVAELSGKGGEMVMDIVRSGNKTGIADVETVDIEQFVQQVQGSRSKWLWQGKPRKTTINENAREWATNAMSPSTSNPADNIEERDRNRLSKKQPETASHYRQHDSSRGLGRIKDAVGLRHATKPFRDGPDKYGLDGSSSNVQSTQSTAASSFRMPPTTFAGESTIVETSETALSQPESVATLQEPRFTKILSETPVDDHSAYLEHVEPPSDEERGLEVEVGPVPFAMSPYRSASPSIAGSMYRGVDLDELFDKNDGTAIRIGPSFKRTHSFSRCEGMDQAKHASKWPRHLSFSLAEDSVLTWERLDEPLDGDEEGVLAGLTSAMQSNRIREGLLELQVEVADWVSAELVKVEQLQRSLDSDQKELDDLYYHKSEEYRELASGSNEVMVFERGQLEEAAKEIEVLGAKLEYEINVVRGKVEDVEDGVVEFERQVVMVENRVVELERAMEPKEGWMHWMRRVLTGIGKETEEPKRAKDMATAQSESRSTMDGKDTASSK